MSGWIATACLIAAFAAIAVTLTHCAARRWEHLIVVALAGALMVPFYAVTGDISAVLPNVWSDGADGKDQIILVSVAATFLWPLSAAAIVVWVAKRLIAKMRGV